MPIPPVHRAQPAPTPLRKSELHRQPARHHPDPVGAPPRHAAALERALRAPLAEGNRVHVLRDGHATYRAMFEAIDAARDHINIENCPLDADGPGQELARRLLDKRRQGVKVNLLFDHAIAWSTHCARQACRCAAAARRCTAGRRSSAAARLSAAERGVAVDLLLPSASDSWAALHAGRSHYGRLLEAGARIHEHQGAPLHGKTAVIDGAWAVVGAGNLDRRGMLHDGDAQLVVVDRRFGTELESVFADDLRHSTEITLAQWRRRGRGRRLLEAVARRLEFLL
jgi:phosphatidylserine/phosphatidylglycerophosphate/cardiolipin synthase-like enzyme